jgi:hypothetical protein
MNNGPYGPTPPPYDPSSQPQQPQQQLAPSSYGYGGPGMGPPSDDTLAWVSVALSSTGWVSCCCGAIPIVGIIGAFGGLLLSLAGAICGYLAWQKAKQQNTRTDIAMVGMVLGISRIVLVVLMIGIGLLMLAMGVGVGLLEGITHPH